MTTFGKIVILRPLSDFFYLYILEIKLDILANASYSELKVEALQCIDFSDATFRGTLRLRPVPRNQRHPETVAMAATNASPPVNHA